MIFSKYLSLVLWGLWTSANQHCLLKSSKQSTCFLTWNNFRQIKWKDNEKKSYYVLCVCLCRLDSRLLNASISTTACSSHYTHEIRSWLKLEADLVVVPVRLFLPLFSVTHVSSRPRMWRLLLSHFTQPRSSRRPPVPHHLSTSMSNRTKSIEEWSQRSEFA